MNRGQTDGQGDSYNIPPNFVCGGYKGQGHDIPLGHKQQLCETSIL